MPIPLIIGVAVGAAGLYKAGRAVYDNSEAESVNSSANHIVSSAEKRMDNVRKACDAALKELGQKKVDILSKNVKDFIATFEQIKNVDFQHDGNFDNLSADEFSDVVLGEMRESVSFVMSSGLGAGSGALAGALTAFGAYNGTMLFAAAGTGTAISSLSGVAATNATLAWLGGGTLASGGAGIAGGTLALGALAAGPAVLVAGWYMGSKAESKLNDAYSNKAKAKKFAADIDAAVALTKGIQDVANTASDILSELRKHSRRSLVKLRAVIEQLGTDFSQYDDEAKNIVLRNVKIIQVIKAVIDTPILDEEGNLLGDTAPNLRKIHQTIQDGFSKVENN